MTACSPRAPARSPGRSATSPSSSPSSARWRNGIRCRRRPRITTPATWGTRRGSPGSRATCCAPSRSSKWPSCPTRAPAAARPASTTCSSRKPPASSAPGRLTRCWPPAPGCSSPPTPAAPCRSPLPSPPAASTSPWPTPPKSSTPPSTPASGGRLVVQAEGEGRLGRGVRQYVGLRQAADGGADGQELGRVLAPDVVLDLHVHADDAGCPHRRGLSLHAGQRQLTGLVDALGELHHLLVLAGLAQRLHDALVGDVVHAGTEHECHGYRAGCQQPEEVLRGQVRGKRTAVGCPVRALAGQVADRGSGRHELQAALAPRVHLHPQLHPDNPVGTQLISLGLHPAHGQFPGVVHRLSQHLQFLVLLPAAELHADVVDRGPDDEAERLETGLTEQYVLRHRQVGSEHPGGVGPGGLREPAGSRLRFPSAC